MKRALSLGLLAILVAGAMGSSAWADDRNDRRHWGWFNRTQHSPRWTANNNWGRNNDYWNNNRPGNYWRYSNRYDNRYGYRYDNRNGYRQGNLQALLSRQESVVNALQARVDGYRRDRRTNTRAYEDDLRRLRIAQADYQRLRNGIRY